MSVELNLRATVKAAIIELIRTEHRRDLWPEEVTEEMIDDFIEQYVEKLHQLYGKPN